MSALSTKLKVGSDEVTFYTTTNETAGYGSYGTAIVGGTSCYYALGKGDTAARGSSVKTGLQVIKGSTTYYMLKTGTKVTVSVTDYLFDVKYDYYSDYANATALRQTDIDALTNIKLAAVSGYAFSGWNKLKTIPFLTTWDTSNVTNMEYIFDSCHAVTALNLSSWDTSKVTNLEYAFCGCESATFTFGSKFNTSKCTDMIYAFGSCKKLPATFPITLDFSSIASSNDVDCMFYDTPVTKVTLKNVKAAIKTDLAYCLKPDGDITITYT